MSRPSNQPTIVMPQPAYAYDNPPSLAGEAYYPPQSNQDSEARDRDRDISRTPSPTPSELDALNGVRQLTMRARILAALNESTNAVTGLYLTLAVVIAVMALIEAYHNKIINALKPVTDWLHRTKAGPVIPILILIPLSFPPLFGHELVAMLFVASSGAWVRDSGSSPVTGTLLGEICTFFVFKSACGARGKRLELTNMSYGALAHVVREGGLPIAIVVRYSALPAHFTTAVFATCGMPLWIFLVAAVASLPKQIVLVYVG
ncbi:hypothetical protein C8R45DRAFT_964423 [Mycena sanguinolenta]|nr:hypothetical protein C8R45DRAFT_964423 [Mycena sanguinolenta]